MNTFKSTLLLVSLMLVLLFLGEWIGGQNGMILAFVISVAMNFTAYFYSDKIALAMYSAQPVTREQLPRGYGGGGRRERGGGGLGALLMIIVAPMAAALIQLAISRSREYEADATGAHTTGNPYAL